MNRDRGKHKGLLGLAGLGIAVAAGYVTWRVAAHRMHLQNHLAVGLGSAFFGCAAIVSAYAHGGARMGGWALALAVLVAALTGLFWMVALYWSRVMDAPGLAAAWMIVCVGALGMVERLAKRVWP